MKRSLSIALPLAAALLSMSGAAIGSPLFNVEVLASATQGGTYSSSIQVVPGQALYYEVVAQLAPIGTVNGTRTITSVTAHPSAGSLNFDGVNSLSFNLTDSASNSFNVNFDSATLPAQWQGSPGFSAGTLSSAGVLAVRPAEAAGVYDGAAAPVVVLSGTLDIDSGAALGASSVISATYGALSSGGEINSNPATGTGGTKILASVATETGANPDFGFTPLTLTTAAAPEPASLSLIAIGLAGLLVRRRRAL